MAKVHEQAPERTERSEAEQPSTGERLREHLGGTPWVIAVKLLLLALVNGFVLFGVPRMTEQRAWSMLGAALVAMVVMDVVYLRRDLLPLKYLIPGTVFLLLFQVYPVAYTFYLSFTNYGAGHILTKQQAIEEILEGNLITPEDAVRYEVVPLAEEGDGAVALLLTGPDGNQFLGTEEGLTLLEEAGDVVREGEQIEQSVPPGG